MPNKPITNLNIPNTKYSIPDTINVALIHDWLTTFGGAERVLLALHDIFPVAPIYTTIYNRANLPQFHNTNIISSYLNHFPYAMRHHQIFIPLMPRAVESFNLNRFELIFSDSHACAKGAIKAPKAKHICYCHTPMRYAWFPDIDPRANSSWLRRLAINRLKKWDLKTVFRIDQFIANSTYTKERIKKIYSRDSIVIYPPIETKRWQPAKKPGDYFLYVGRLVSYKKPDIVVEAFNRIGLPLKIIGTGPELAKLKTISHNNIEFLDRVTDDQLKHYYSQCLALIFPAIEDFGMIPVEVMASGRPVISFNIGGAAETVIPNLTGLHFTRQTASAIIDSIKKFKPEKYNSQAIRKFALQFDITEFQSKIKKVVEDILNS